MSVASAAARAASVSRRANAGASPAPIAATRRDVQRLRAAVPTGARRSSTRLALRRGHDLALRPLPLATPAGLHADRAADRRRAHRRSSPSIAIPSLISARAAANEASAIGSSRTRRHRAVAYRRRAAPASTSDVGASRRESGFAGPDFALPVKHGFAFALASARRRRPGPTTATATRPSPTTTSRRRRRRRTSGGAASPPTKPAASGSTPPASRRSSRSSSAAPSRRCSNCRRR